MHMTSRFYVGTYSLEVEKQAGIRFNDDFLKCFVIAFTHNSWVAIYIRKITNNH